MNGSRLSDSSVHSYNSSATTGVAERTEKKELTKLNYGSIHLKLEYDFSNSKVSVFIACKNGIRALIPPRKSDSLFGASMAIN